MNTDIRTRTDAEILEYWAATMHAGNCTPNTVKERLIWITATLRRTGRTLATITREDLIVDQSRIKPNGKRLAPSTRAGYRSAARSLFGWLVDEGFRGDDPAAKLPKVRIPQPEPNPIPTHLIERLLTSGIYAKTRMYVLLYAYQGFRAVEIAAVDLGQSIDWERQLIRSDEAKGGNVVWRPIHPVVWDELQRYPRTGWLFPSPDGQGHVSRGNVSSVLGRALKRARIPHRPHQLRAWHATEQIEAGVPTAIVQQSMRHTSSSSIKYYVRVSHESIAGGMATLPTVAVPQQSGRERRAA